MEPKIDQPGRCAGAPPCQYLNGWVAHFRLCTAEAVKGLRAIDAHIRRRLRAIIIRQRTPIEEASEPGCQTDWPFCCCQIDGRKSARPKSQRLALSGVISFSVSS
jgi:hypothetical protein